MVGLMSGAYNGLPPEDKERVFLLSVGKDSFSSQNSKFCQGFASCPDDGWWSSWGASQRDVYFFKKKPDGSWEFYCHYSMNTYAYTFADTIREMLDATGGTPPPTPLPTLAPTPLPTLAPIAIVTAVSSNNATATAVSSATNATVTAESETEEVAGNETDVEVAGNETDVDVAEDLDGNFTDAEDFDGNVTVTEDLDGNTTVIDGNTTMIEETGNETAVSFAEKVSSSGRVLASNSFSIFMLMAVAISWFGL